MSFPSYPSWPLPMLTLLATSCVVGRRSKLAPSLHSAPSQSIPGISDKAWDWR